MKNPDLKKIKMAASSCLADGDFLKAHIIPVKDGVFKGEFHVITNGGGRQSFKNHKAACEWAAAYFIAASIMDKDTLDNYTDEDAENIWQAEGKSI